jgi:hypothetical protein
LDDAQIEAMLARLEARGQHPRFLEMLDAYLEAMAIDGAAHVLDLGTGTGARPMTRSSRTPCSATCPIPCRPCGKQRAWCGRAAIIGAIVSGPDVMRQMPRMLAAAGLELFTHFGWVLTDVGRADFWQSGIDMYRTLLPSTGALSTEEANGWADAQDTYSATGTSFGSANFYAYVAGRPA